ncbi:hypothetical protein HPB50_010799 [Hyalomma asiaticum]|uniref:Uncharacterized protein n=1 Tax=Hyalomma asiaticum TaxID=266040 RepID=A0ACB7TG52_HYAAI|nr:hypothetical protein HPB50_010799 [Hyalomma asiaticum]
MEYVVEGQTISAEELADASWQTPGYRAQERRRWELQNQGKPNVDPSASDLNARTAAPGPRHQVSKNLHRPPDATRHVAAAAAAAHRALKTVPHLFHHSKLVTARTTAVTGPDHAPGAQDPAQLIAVSADLAPTHGDRDPVQPYEPIQDPVRLAKALEQYLRR